MTEKLGLFKRLFCSNKKSSIKSELESEQKSETEPKFDIHSAYFELYFENIEHIAEKQRLEKFATETLQLAIDHMKENNLDTKKFRKKLNKYINEHKND